MALKHNQHIQVDILYDRLRNKGKYIHQYTSDSAIDCFLPNLYILRMEFSHCSH